MLTPLQQVNYEKVKQDLCQCSSEMVRNIEKLSSDSYYYIKMRNKVNRLSKLLKKYRKLK